MKKLGMLIAGTLAFASSPVAAQPKGPDLYESCVSAGKGTVQSATCDLLLYSVTAGLYLGQGMSGSGVRACLPEKRGSPTLNLGQARAIVEKFMRDHPELLNEEATTLVYEALAVAFPCKAESSDFTAQTLYEWCSSKKESLKFFNCVLYIGGFVAGVNDERMLAEAATTGAPTLGCLPRGLSGEAAAATFVRMWRSILEKKGPHVVPGLGPIEAQTPELVLGAALTGPCEIKK